MNKAKLFTSILFLFVLGTYGYSEEPNFEPESVIEEVAYEPEEFEELSEVSDFEPETAIEEVAYEPEEFEELSEEFESEPEECLEVSEEAGEEIIDILSLLPAAETPDEGCVCVCEEEEVEMPSIAYEPVILSLGLPECVTMESRLNLNEFYAEDGEVTTGSASEYFEVSEFGVEVKKSGLYRVSFYQGISSGSLPCDVAVVLKQGFGKESVKRAQRIKLKRGDFTDIAFSKILNVQEGEKISLKMWPISGEAELAGEFHSSGFTIEAL
ncbi:MAG: hypothetical protein P0S96_02900 [Simkaniaceae bacterium]|nr:hypothetical protein [Candidatus Sacchlamyda saccharinae]